MTTLSPELQQAAQDFGAALRQHGMVQQYLNAVSALNADPAARDLDECFETEKRDNTFTMAKGYLADLGLDFNQALGLDYVEIASS